MEFYLGDWALVAVNLIGALLTDVIVTINEGKCQPNAADYFMMNHKECFVAAIVVSMATIGILLTLSTVYPAVVTLLFLRFHPGTLIWSFLSTVSCLFVLPALYLCHIVDYLSSRFDNIELPPPQSDKLEPEQEQEPQSEKTESEPESEEETRFPKCRGHLNIPQMTNIKQENGENVGDIMNKALHGVLDCDYPKTSKIVRIFTSSTFTDTQAERNALMEYTYPKLRRHCRERGYDFQVVDMRWGVRDEATEDHMTSELCMRELRKCQQFSTGPNFITFLAQKYGYRPFPPKIEAREFEDILDGVDKEEDKELLCDWFRRDDNSLPPYYCLSPIRIKLPDYANDDAPDLKAKARAKWWECFEKIQVILREASCKKMDGARAHKYYWAVTEEEIHNGILSRENTDTACYWFKRTLHGLPENAAAHNNARFYMDINNGQADTEALDYLQKLKDDSLPRKLSADNITSYAIPWTENGVDIRVKEHAAYIKVFCSDFETVLTSMIDRGIESKANLDISDAFVLEAMAHAQFAQRKCRYFHGRRDFLKEIQQLVADWKRRRRPVVISGEPGVGKTSLMAKLASLTPVWFERKDIRILLRFCGTTRYSSITRDLLRSLCAQMHRLNDTEGRITEIPSTLKELKKYFRHLLERQTQPTVLILDSFDQLRDFGGGLSDWIPKDLPLQVTLLLSCIPFREYAVGPELKSFLPKECFKDVPLFNREDIREVITEWLKDSDRELQAPQYEHVVAACTACALPLYVKLAYDCAARWRSYQPLQECVLGHMAEDTIGLLFDRLEKYHGNVLVRHALGYITAAKSGFSPSEMEDILSLDDAVLNDVYQYHTPPLRRLPPLIWVRIQDELDQYLITAGADGVQVITWYHRQFHVIARQRFLTREARAELCGIIGDYFLGLWSEGSTKDFVDKQGTTGTADRLVPTMPYQYEYHAGGPCQYNLRKMSELPHALTLAEDVGILKEEALLNFDFLYYKLKALSLDSIFEDLDFTKENKIDDPEINLLYSCLEMSREALALSADHLPACLLGRLGQQDPTQHPAIHRLLQQAARPTFDCLYSTQGTMKVRGGITLGKFVGHSDHIQGKAISRDNTFMVSLGAICWSEEHRRLYVMYSDTIDMWDIFAERRVDKLRTGDREQPLNWNDYNRGAKDFITAFGNDTIFYKVYGNTTEFLRSGTNEKQDSYILHSKTGISDRHFKFAVLSSGYLVCYNIKVQRQHSPTDAILDVIHIATARRHRCITDIDMGYFLTMEYVLATGPETFVITTYPNGATEIHCGNIHDTTLVSAMTMTATIASKMISTQDNRLIVVYMTNTTIMEFLDLSAVLNAQIQDSREEDVEEPEMFWIMGAIPGSSRYIHCVTITQALCVWDLHRRRSARIMDTDFVNMFACILNPTSVLGASYQTGFLYSADMRKAEVNWKKDKVLHMICDGQFRLGRSSDGHVVMVGPSASSLCGLDPLTGEIAWTIDAGQEELGGLVVNENGAVALCETPLPVGSKPYWGPEKRGSKIHVFDLKAKTKLPDLTYKPTQNPMRTMLELSKLCVLTPEGDYYCVAIHDEHYVYMVYSTKTGEGRRIPLGEREYISGFVYSRQLESVVMAAQDGVYVICRLMDLTITRFRVTQPKQGLVNSISYDGRYMVLLDAYKRNILYVIDLVTKCPFASYVADNEVAITSFSTGNHFLLVACRTLPGLIQLCMYENHKGQGSALLGTTEDEQGARGGAYTWKDDGGPDDEDDCTSNSDTGEEPYASVVGCYGSTLEKQYLELMALDDDIYGQPKKCDLRDQ